MREQIGNKAILNHKNHNHGYYTSRSPKHKLETGKNKKGTRTGTIDRPAGNDFFR